MKIALVTTSFLPQVGGAEFAIHHLAHQWYLQGHEVCVFNTVTDEPTHAQGEYTVRRYKILRGGTYFGYHRFPFRWYGTRQLEGLLRDYRPDFTSAHFGYPVSLWMSRIRPIPKHLITCHGPALNETPRGPRQVFGIDRVIAEALNQAFRVVAISSHARSVMEKIGVDPSKIVDIPNGADLEKFSRKSDFNLREKFGMPPDAMIVLSVGRESWAKAYDIGIRAFAQAAGENAQLYYVILGRGTTRWEEFKRQLPGAERVIFCEGLYGDDLVGAYQQSDIFLLPSIKELCPLVVPEAMAAGLPLVVTDVSGSQDMVRNGQNGIVVPPGDPNPLAEALTQLIRQEPLRKKYGQDNLARAKDYDWTSISRRYLEYA